jgi:hypothetical protein
MDKKRTFYVNYDIHQTGKDTFDNIKMRVFQYLSYGKKFIVHLSEQNFKRYLYEITNRTDDLNIIYFLQTTKVTVKSTKRAERIECYH